MAEDGCQSAYLDSNRDTGTTVDEHLVVSIAQANETTAEGIAARDPKPIGIRNVKHDGLLELDLLDVPTPVALSVGAVGLLRNHMAELREHLCNVVDAWDRLDGTRNLGSVRNMVTGEVHVGCQGHVPEPADGGSRGRSISMGGVGAFWGGRHSWTAVVHE